MLGFAALWARGRALQHVARHGRSGIGGGACDVAIGASGAGGLSSSASRFRRSSAAASEVLTFGKYKGQTFDVAAQDGQYCEWIRKHRAKVPIAGHAFIDFLDSRSAAHTGLADAPPSDSPPVAASSEPVTGDGEPLATAEPGMPAEGTGDALIVHFGKYRGQALEDVASRDLDYCKWVLSRVDEALASGRADELNPRMFDFARQFKALYGDVLEIAAVAQQAGQSGGPDAYAQQDLDAGASGTWSPTPPQPAMSFDAGQQIVNFGKHRGQTFQHIRDEQRDYCKWVLKKAKGLQESGEEAKVDGLLQLAAYLKGDSAAQESAYRQQQQPQWHLKQQQQQEQWWQPEPRTQSRGDAAADSAQFGPQEFSIESGRRLVGFGQYRAATHGELYAKDPHYCEWFLRQVLSKPEAKEAEALSLAVFILHRRATGA